MKNVTIDDESSGKPRVVIDGGHFTLHKSNCNSSEEIVPGLYYAKISTELPHHPSEILRTNVDNNRLQNWVVYRVDDGTNLKGIAEEFVKISAPSLIELESMQQAIKAYIEISKSGQPAILRLMIGDTFIPPELRRQPVWMIPSVYSDLFQANGLDNVHLLLQSRCRNMASRKNERFKKITDLAGHFSQSYESQGYGVVQVSAGYYLISDYLLDQSQLFEPALLLMYGGNTLPTCSFTQAACMLDLTELGASRYIAFFSGDDDFSIEAKIREGAIIAAHLGEPSSMTCEIHTLHKGQESTLTKLDFGIIQQCGQRNNFHELVSETRQKMSAADRSWVDDKSDRVAKANRSTVLDTRMPLQQLGQPKV